MEIHVHLKNVRIDPTTVEGAVERALERFAARLTRVDVFLHDVNAKKGGVDKRCVLEARPRKLDPIAVETEATGAVEAVNAAAGKLERVLAHRFGKMSEPR